MYTLTLFALLLQTPQPPATPVQQAWTMLKDALDDSSAARRAKALHALALLKSLKAEKLAEAGLDDKDKNVRSEAAATLGEMKIKTSLPKLRACLDDKEIQVVLACTNSLFVMKDPAAYQVYYGILSGERKGSKGLIKSQLDTLRDKKQIEQLAFETGIGFVPYGGMGWQAIKTVTHDDSSPVRAMAAVRLANDPDTQSGELLTHSLDDKKSRVRAAVVDAIAKRGDPKMLSAIAPLLEDDDESVRYESAAAVIHLSEETKSKRKKSTNKS